MHSVVLGTGSMAPEIAAALAAAGGPVVVCGRSPERAAQAARRATDLAGGGEISAVPLDATAVARAGLVEYERRLAINYLISKASDGERVARAQTVQVAVHAASGVLQFDCPAEFVSHVRAMIVRAGA